MIPIPDREEMEEKMCQDRIDGLARVHGADVVRVDKNGNLTFLTEDQWKKDKRFKNDDYGNENDER